MKYALLALFLSALLLIHALIGGTRLLFSLPAYGLLAAAALLAAFHRPSGGLRPATSCLIATGLMAGYVAIRAMLSPVDYLWWPDFYMVLACAIAYLLVACHFTRLEERHLILGALILVAMAEVLVALRQFSAGDDFMPLGLRRPESGRRASGFLISPNHLAGYLEVIGVMALSCACWSQWRGWVRGLAGYAAAACFVGVAITGSRGGYLSTAFCLVVFGAISIAIVASADRRRAMLLGLAGAVFLVLAGFGAYHLMSGNPLLKERMDRLGAQFTGGRLDIRIYNWQATLDQFRIAPVLGTGAGTHLYYGRYFRREPLQSDPVHAHSDYLELLAEYGVVGAGVVAIFLGAHLFMGLRRLRKILHEDLLPRGILLDDDLALLVGSLSALAAYAAHSVVDFNLHIPGNALVFAFIFALLAGRRSRAGAEESTRFDWSRAALPALGAWVAVSGLPKLPGEYWAEEARKAVGRRKLPEVSELSEKALQWEKENPYIYFYLGEAKRVFAANLQIRALRGPLFEEAIAAYRQSLALFPQDVTTWVRLAQALDGMKRFEEAEAAFRTALDLDPQLGVLHLFYAAHLRLCGRFDAAEEELQKGQRLHHLNLAPIMERMLEEP